MSLPLEPGCGPSVESCENLPAGTYITSGSAGYLPGLSLTLPPGWSSVQQDFAEFELHQADDAAQFRQVLLWQDMRPWVSGAPVWEQGSVDRLEESLLTDPRLVAVSGPERNFRVRGADGEADGNITARSITVALPNDATSEYDCPFVACVDFIGNPAWGHGAGLFSGAEPTQAEMDALIAAGSLPPGATCPCANAFRLFLFTHPGAAAPDHVVIVALGAVGADPVAALDDWELKVQSILNTLVFP